MLSRRRAIGGLVSLAASGALSGCAADRAAPFWYSYGGKTRDVLLGIVEAFHASQKEHRVAPVYQGDYFETLAKLRTALHVGLAPAVTHVVGESVPYLADAGVLEPLDDVAAALDLVPSLTQEGMFGAAAGRPTFALPFNRSTPVLYVNEPMLAAEGVEVPTTWDGLRAAARALTRQQNGDARFGFACAIDWWFWVALAGQAGGSVFDADGQPTLDTEGGRAGVELWRELIAAGTMRPPPGRDYNAWQVVNGDFVAQKAAMIWTSCAYLRYFDANAKFPWRAHALPGFARQGEAPRRSAPTGGTFFVIPKGAPPHHRAAARAFLAFVLRPEHANTFATATGYIPVNREGVARLEQDGFYAQSPNDRVAVDQLPVTTGWPWSRSLLRVQREIIQPALEDAILGGRATRDVLADAQRAAMEGT